MNPSTRTVDLGNCDREPIHQLGMIQDFGALIAVNHDWLVAHRSANLAAVLGLAEDVEPGVRLQSLIATEAVQRIRSAVSAAVSGDHVERLFGIDLRGNGELFDCALHSSGALTIIEIEPHRHGDLERQIAMLRPIMARLERHKGVTPVCEEAARQLRLALGFDRVMVYRFRPDQSGEVIAEARRDDLEAFLGLRYPKTDIPEQARRLYLRNRFRIISDVRAEPVPIEPGATLDGSPIDLSMSTLRSVSPIHIEYLRNMGVDASLSISIVIGGQLWGLFACHHYSPKVLPYSQRTAAELFSELVSLALERAQSWENSQLRDVGREVHDKLMRDIAAGASLAESLPTIDPVIQRVIAHDGASVFVEDVYDSRGRAPNEEEFRAILPALNGAATGRIFATDALAERLPRAERFADRAVGALVIPVSRTPRDFLVLWRSELTQVVTWAGNPDKPVETGPNGARLTPRKSFEAWQQSVEGRSEAWTESELQIAEGLRMTLLEVILRLTDEAVQERARAQQQQELLIAELNHRVRNILNLIRGLISQSRDEARDIESFSEIVGGRISSLAAAHDNITRGNWSPAPLAELIDTEAEAYAARNRDRVELSGPAALVAPEAYTVLSLVIHEMITNSAKYGALSDNSGKLDIAVSRADSDDLVIHWRERGGPPVKPPTRRGFGSTIIERSLPFELGGEAKIEYRLSGVEARFCIPARHVTWTKGETMTRGEPVEPKPGSTALEATPESVLLVEDSMIIALDTEDSLRDLGVRNVEVASTVAGAISALKKSRPDLALLDFNLGKESSEPVAHELREQGVPFWLATGYGELRDKVEELGAQGVLTKPYGRDDLTRIMSEFASSSAE